MNAIPWIVYDAMDFIEGLLTKTMTVFEYGSGGSTLWLVKRVGMLYSVEHDLEWAACVRIELEKRKITNCDFRCIPPELLPDSYHTDPMDPTCYGTMHKPLNQYQFETYVRSIENFSDASLDMVIVDGRARPACIGHAMSKLRCGGYLVLDNSNRDNYLQGIALLGSWPKFEFLGFTPFTRAFISQTSIFKKPNNSHKFE